MSAYIVDEGHIDFLVTAASGFIGPVTGPDSANHGLSWLTSPLERLAGEGMAEYNARRRDLRDFGIADVDRETEVGRMLLVENAASVFFRYPDGGMNEGTEVADYVFTRYPGPIDAVDVVQACHGFRYQACEHPGWATSEAAQFVEALLEKALRVITRQSDAWSPVNPVRAAASV